MKVLVTGATGFIGNHVLQQLMKYDHEIVAATRGVLEIDKTKYRNKIKFVYFNIDEISDENYFEYFGKPDVLIHLAWQGLPNYKSLFHFEKNLPVQYSFLKNIITNGLKKLTVTGTCLEYGMQQGCLSENMISDPRNPYPLAKDTLRKFLTELQKHYEFDLNWLRLFYIYGDGQNPNSLLSQLKTALQNGDEVFNMSGGEQLRDYLPVEKVAEYIVKLSLQNKSMGIINCCSGKPIRVIQLVCNYLRDNNKTIQLNQGYYPYSDYEPMAFWGDNIKLKTIINE